MSSIPRIVIAGTHSGCGKTTLASGIMAALTARGLKVQPFKVGPDFIDPSHHTRICGRVSRNLDPYMMRENGVLDTFLRSVSGADVAVIEGVMGMFDGVDGSDLASTAHVARILQAPVVLIVDARGMSRSVNALAEGFRMYDPSTPFAGVICNRVGSPRHRSLIESSRKCPIFGFVPRRDELSLESRHLGLRMAHETAGMEEFGRIVADSCDLDALLAAAERAPDLTPGPMPGHVKKKPACRIGIGLDAAFCFYYRDNLDRLEEAGAELVFFSPLRDSLPDLDAVYLGGGYPELHLPVLESSSCTAGLHAAAEGDMPIYAECGGLMYLSREIRSEKKYRMCGILPAEAEMTNRIQALGYVKGSGTGKIPFMPASQRVTGHEFHYSRIEADSDARFAMHLTRGRGILDGQDGLISQNSTGCYTHAYFPAAFARQFVRAAHLHHKR